MREGSLSAYNIHICIQYRSRELLENGRTHQSEFVKYVVIFNIFLDAIMTHALDNQTPIETPSAVPVVRSHTSILPTRALLRLERTMNSLCH